MGCLIVLDTETTGLSPDDAGIVDLAAAAVRDGEIVSRFETLVWPGRRFLQARHRDVLARVSGINALDLLNEAVPDYAGTRDLFHEWMIGVEDAYGLASVLTSFNVDGRKFVAELPLDWPWASCLMLAAMQPMGDAGALYRRADGSAKWPSLREACRYFNVPFVETHRAASDALAAAHIAIALGMGR